MIAVVLVDLAHACRRWLNMRLSTLAPAVKWISCSTSRPISSCEMQALQQTKRYRILKWKLGQYEYWLI